MTSETQAGGGVCWCSPGWLREPVSYCPMLAGHNDFSQKRWRYRGAFPPAGGEIYFFRSDFWTAERQPSFLTMENEERGWRR
jgi:hypothetical protein